MSILQKALDNNKWFMKNIFWFFFFSLPFKNFAQNTIKSRTIYILSCESGILYKHEKNKIIVEGGPFFGSKPDEVISKQQTSSNDTKKINLLFDNFTQIPDDDLLSNDCVADGFNFKIFLKSDNILKRILVSNYYDSRVDSLLKIFDKYITVSDGNFQYNRMGYGNDSKELIESQNSCTNKTTEDHKKFLLNEFCELERKIK
jgi:hypothetical protein